MKLVEVTFTLTKKIRVEVPSCLNNQEIGQLAQQHLRDDPELFVGGTTEAVTLSTAADLHPKEWGLHGVAVDGAVNLRFSDEDDAVDSDEEFEKLTGRAPPPSPLQKSFFEPEKT